MSLFKTTLIKNEILNFVEGDYLTLRCSRIDNIKAPFDAELTAGNGSCVLKCGDVDLYINHIIMTTDTKMVNAGDVIGQPMVDGMFGQSAAYILVKIYKDGKLDDIVKYLKFKDETEENKEEKKEVEVEVKPKKTTTKKKSSSKKKKK